MTSGADYPGFPEPEKETKSKEKKREQRVRAVGASLERGFHNLIAGAIDLLKVLTGSFIGALMALELNRVFAGEPPIDGLLQFYIAFGALYVVTYIWKAAFDRIRPVTRN